MNDEDIFCYNHAENLLSVPFQPFKIFMNPENGRVYHPAPEKTGSIGLIMSKLAIEFSKTFVFEEENESPTHIYWNGIKHRLLNDWYYKVNSN